MTSRFRSPFCSQRGDELAGSQGTVLDPADGQSTDVVVVVQRGDLKLQRHLGVVAWRRHRLQDGVEQRHQRVILAVGLEAARAGLGVGVEDREFEQLLGSIQLDEEIVDLVEDFGRARVAAIDLVEHHDRRQPGLERLAQHEAGLGHRTSEASTSSMTASTILRMRSTSPPKSAWPGVSTILMRVSR